MKQVIIILFAIIISEGNQKYKKSDLIGAWEAVSITELETGEIELLEDEFDKFVVEVRLDSIYLYEDDVYAWKIEGDSIIVDWASFYIKELTSNNLTLVQYVYFFGEEKEEIKFKKIK